MTEREKVLKGLEYHLKELSVGKTCYECPYCGDNPCEIQLIANAIALLKEQEPRVLTLDETVNLIGVPRWAEYKVAIPGTNDVMVQAGWVMVIDEQLINREYDEHFVTFADEFGTHKYHVGAYKKGWRCWSSKPTDEQREATPWQD